MISQYIGIYVYKRLFMSCINAYMPIAKTFSSNKIKVDHVYKLTYMYRQKKIRI